MRKLFLALVLFGSCLKLFAQTADGIINRYITYIGGARNWNAVQSVTCSGTYNYGGMEFPFQSVSKRPDLYKFIVPFKGKYFAQAYDGKSGWKIDAFNGETKKTPLSGKDARAMMNEADVELESPFIDYKAKGHRVVLEGRDTVNGILCYKIRLTRKNGEEETDLFSTADGALLQKQAVSRNSELKNGILTTVYSNYQQVEGIRVPFLAVSSSNGDTILKIIILKMEVNKVVADDEFKF